MAKASEKVPVYAIKRNGRLEPSAAIDAEAFDAIANGSEVEMTIKQKRSLPALRYYWAVVGAVVNATGKWPTKENLSDELKMACGVTELRRRLAGEYYFAPSSVAFEKMDEREFKAFMDRAFAQLAEHIGCDPLELLPVRRHAA